MKNNKGQALVEFIIVLPLLILIITAIVDMGNIFYQKYKLENDLDYVTDLYKNGKVSDINSYVSSNDLKISYVSQNTEYLKSLVNDYWFITDAILDSRIYYPLEGYLYPETYRFKNKDVSIKEIFKNLLDQMDTVLTPYKEAIENSKFNVHEIFTLASIVEKESKNKDDYREKAASVFENRLAHNMSLGSDVTAYYALKIDNALEWIEKNCKKDSKGNALNCINYNVVNINNNLDKVQSNLSNLIEQKTGINIKEYQEFLSRVLEVLDHQHQPIVFLLWGGPARKLKAYLHNPSHLILECIHPSPLAANHGGWFGNNHFKKANEYLSSHGLSKINWSNI